MMMMLMVVGCGRGRGQIWLAEGAQTLDSCVATLLRLEAGYQGRRRQRWPRHGIGAQLPRLMVPLLLLVLQRSGRAGGGHRRVALAQTVRAEVSA